MERLPYENRGKRESQFIVNEGIVYSKKDIMVLLWDLGYVSYYEVEGESILHKGKGFIMRVSLNNEDPTLFLNGRIYINVNNIDYMRVNKLKDSLTLYELHYENHVIKIVPDTKKQAYPPYRYIADTMVGLGVMEEEDMPPEGLDEPFGGFSDIPPGIPEN
jgi:hypothetical protein